MGTRLIDYQLYMALNAEPEEVVAGYILSVAKGE